MEAARIYLVRHGRTAWNDLGQTQGHTDIGLDEIGQAQAQALATRFSGQKLDRVISSDLRRAFETAAPVARLTGAPHETTASLRERSFGDWEGANYIEVMARLAPTRETAWMNVRPPGGESYDDIWRRVLPVAESLLASEGQTMVVSHGGTSSVLLAQLVHGTHDTARAFRFANASVTLLERRPEGLFRLVKYDDTSHLP